MSGSQTKMSSAELVARLSKANAYPHRCDGPVVTHQTHISWVFLVGDYAYKVKKPIRTDFLDYSTLERRRHFCEEELRLDRRYAEGLYLDVVEIRADEGDVHVDSPQGVIVEYAVKMRRFPEDALFSHRLRDGRVTPDDVRQLARRVAAFHDSARRVDPSLPWGSEEVVLEDALDNFDTIAEEAHTEPWPVGDLRKWTDEFARRHRTTISSRLADGFVRECHGDLHLANIIDWNGKIVPFDGIEFSQRYRWIDVLSDAAFVVMDFAARGHFGYANRFLNDYLERSGDYGSMAMVRWYLAYRAMVRAKVACLAARPGPSEPHDQTRHQASTVDWPSRQLTDCGRHIELAAALSRTCPRRIWITHGLSGSGKTFHTDRLLGQCEPTAEHWGKIRIRSDVERKRQFGMSPTDRPSEGVRERLYDDSADRATYDRLETLTRQILDGGFQVIVDATFLRRRERDRFRELARACDAPLGILHCEADPQTLRQRILDRADRGGDASDAGPDVLEQQLATYQPLEPDERDDVTTIR